MNDLWWQQAIIYQIYPKSFMDQNKDGIGDLQGIIAKLDTLKELGVNTLWLNPIFLSAQVDNGYDIIDYQTIDPLFGTMEDVEQLIKEVHARDMKLIFDFVLNHTSDQHPWFQEAIKDTKSPYHSYYYFTKERPNAWASFFGGSTFDQTKNGEYYFHLFDKKMPDLNWKEPKVREEMLEIARFWAKKGIDGLRLDAFIHLGKADFTEGKQKGEYEIQEECYAHLPEVHTYLEEFCQTLRQEFPNLFFVGEAASAGVEQAKSYVFPKKTECDSVISFRYFPDEKEGSRAFWEKFAQTMDEWQEGIGTKGYPTLYWNNHDMPRMVSRFGSETYRAESQKTLATLMYLQKGIPILLYGEEIGMKNYELSSIDELEEKELQKEATVRIANGEQKEEVLAELAKKTRNASRGIMQWKDAEDLGFGSSSFWLGGNQEKIYNVHDQKKEVDSIWHYYQQLLALKKTELFTKGTYQRLHHPELYAYQREYQGKKAYVLCNVSEKEVTTSKFTGKVLLEQGIKREEKTWIFVPWASVVIEEEEDE